jgi:uncharacterized protein YdiU (UPF0061 family)
LKITNTFTEQLPGEKNTENYSRQVHHACYSFVHPKPPVKPELIHHSKEVLQSVGLENSSTAELTEFLSGATILAASKPFAMCYGGHQFGQWAGQLGDGRAINIAEIEHQTNKLTIQLKGAGPTPYSRGADGFAVLRSSIREYLCSEAMHHLGIPTTRALSLALSGDKVVRDMLYDGNPKEELGAIVARVAPSFVRFGSFEIFAARRDKETLKKLTDFVIQEHYSHLGKPSKATYLAFFKAVVNRTKTLILHWQRVGFVHGVMNTDNLSILGLTIDYGPYGWLEDFNPNWTPNTTDKDLRRYRFGNQYPIALWNLTQLANALYPLIEDVDALKKILRTFKIEFQEAYSIMMLSKLGIANQEDTDGALIEELQQLLEESAIDMTLFFRNLNRFDQEHIASHLSVIENDSYLTKELFETHQNKWKNWLSKYAKRIRNINEDSRIERINSTNPKYVLRNYMAQLAIEAAEKGNYDLINELFELLKQPYAEQPEHEKWFAKRPKWADEKIGCSMLSCSS